MIRQNEQYAAKGGEADGEIFARKTKHRGEELEYRT